MPRLEIQKGSHLFVLAYDPGSEREALDAIVAMANDDRLPLTMFDALCLADEIGRNLAKSKCAKQQSLP